MEDFLMELTEEKDDENAKLPVLEKVSYAFTDMAGNLLYVSMSSYILYFYTDVFGIPVSSAGMIILLACIVDAVSAIFWGSIVDHTHTKWGAKPTVFSVAGGSVRGDHLFGLYCA